MKSPEEATRLLSDPCSRRDGRRVHGQTFKFFLFGKHPREVISGLKKGLRNAARDMNVRHARDAEAMLKSVCRSIFVSTTIRTFRMLSDKDPFCWDS